MGPTAVSPTTLTLNCGQDVCDRQRLPESREPDSQHLGAPQPTVELSPGTQGGLGQGAACQPLRTAKFPSSPDARELPVGSKCGPQASGAQERQTRSPVRRGCPAPKPTCQVCAWPPGTLTWGGAWGEAGGDLGQRVPPACAAGQGFLHLLLLVQAWAWPGLLADGRVQKAAGGDGAMPAHPAEAGVHREQQGL